MSDDLGAGEVVGDPDAHDDPERGEEIRRERGARAGGGGACARRDGRGSLGPGRGQGASFHGAGAPARQLAPPPTGPRAVSGPTTTSTRRFAARPRAVKFGRIGLSPPRPAQVTRGAGDAELDEPPPGGLRHRGGELRVGGAVARRVDEPLHPDLDRRLRERAPPRGRRGRRRAAGRRSGRRTRRPRRGRARPPRAASPTRPGAASAGRTAGAPEAAAAGCGEGGGVGRRPARGRAAPRPRAPRRPRRARACGARACARRRSSACGPGRRAARASGRAASSTARRSGAVGPGVRRGAVTTAVSAKRSWWSPARESRIVTRSSPPSLRAPLDRAPERRVGAEQLGELEREARPGCPAAARGACRGRARAARPSGTPACARRVDAREERARRGLGGERRVGAVLEGRDERGSGRARARRSGGSRRGPRAPRGSPRRARWRRRRRRAGALRRFVASGASYRASRPPRQVRAAGAVTVPSHGGHGPVTWACVKLSP